MLVLISDILQNVVDHPSPLVDTGVNWFGDRLIDDAVHVLEEFFPSRWSLTANLLCSLHVSDSKSKELPRQTLVTLRVPFHTLDRVSKDFTMFVHVFVVTRDKPLSVPLKHHCSCTLISLADGDFTVSRGLGFYAKYQQDGKSCQKEGSHVVEHSCHRVRGSKNEIYLGVVGEMID